MNSVFMLILVGPLLVGYGQEYRPLQDIKTFKFFKKDSCEQAADAMYHAFEVMGVFCIEVKP